MDKILILGASALQMPAIKKAKEMGLYVGVIDYNPDAVGIPFADKYYNVSTIDEEGVYKAAKEFNANGIITLATDMPMRSLAYSCEKLGLTGLTYDSAVKSTDKGEMIKAFEAAGVEHPKFQIISSINDLCVDDINFPCVSKPTDNSGSRGVMLIENREQLDKALEFSFKCARKGSIIIEEYMVGPEVSVEAFIIDGKPEIIQVTDKITTGAPHFVELGHNQPSALDGAVLDKVKDLAVRAALSLGINNCAVHAEIIVTKDGPKMVEIGARLGGDCIATDLVPLSTGVDMVEEIISIALGKKTSLIRKFNNGSAIRFFDTKPGLITGIYGIEEAKKIKGVDQIYFAKSEGTYHKGISGGSGERIGFVIAHGRNLNEAISVCDKVLNTIEIHSKDN